MGFGFFNLSSFKSTLFGLLFFTSFLKAWNIEILASSEDCYFADLKQYDMLLLSYDVLEGGDQLIDFKLLNPFGVLLQETPARKDAYYSYNASNPGLHKYCFSNQITTKRLSFNPNIVKHNTEEKKQSTDQQEVESEIRKMEELVDKIESQLHFSLNRDYDHKKVARAFDSKLKWWTIIQAVLVIGACIWQVSYLKSFFEVRRVV